MLRAMGQNPSEVELNTIIMEIDIDDVPWKDELVTHPPEIRDGKLVISDRPGWGTDIDETVVAAHPPRR